MVYSLAERVFILEHNFAPKSFAAVREVFSKAYPEKQVPNKTSIRRLATKFREGKKCSSVSDKIAPCNSSHFEQQCFQLQQQDTAAIIQCSYGIFRRMCMQPNTRIIDVLPLILIIYVNNRIFDTAQRTVCILCLSTDLDC
jgi:hypothetical protein